MTMDWQEHAHEHGGEHAPCPPTPAQPRPLIPERPMLVRGLAFAGLALGAFAAAWKTAAVSPWLLPLVPVLGVTGLLSAWAAAIHLTGGEQFDDHPWV